MENINYTKTEEDLYLPTRSTRRKIVVCSLLFCWAVVVYLTGWGNPENSLHTSLLSWCFFSWLGIVAAYVGGASWENVQMISLQQSVLSNRSDT